MLLFTYKNLYKAYLDCRKHKRQTINALKFEINLEENLKLLLEDLRNGLYQPGRSICFVVTEPCPREIFAADFRDRVVHHLFVSQLIEQAEKMFIFDSYACRKNKGTHKAVSRANSFIRRAAAPVLCHCEERSDEAIPRKERLTRDCHGLRPRNDRDDTWYMKIDIASFFMSIDRDILFEFVLELINKHKKSDNWKTSMSDLAKIIIFHDPKSNYIRKGDPRLAELIPARKSLFGIRPGKGLPIGNYSSQFFANLYLNKLDHFVKRELKCEYYLRYVDDMLFLSKARSKQIFYRDKINEFLYEKLNMKLNNKKTIIQPVERGVDFLCYFL